MAESEQKPEPTQDDINLFVLNELEAVNAVLDLVVEHAKVPPRVLALARLQVRLKQLDRQRKVASQRDDFDQLMEIGAEREKVTREIRLLEAQSA